MICQHTDTLINTHDVKYFYSRPFRSSWLTVILSLQGSWCTSGPNLSHICFQAASSSCLRFCPLWHKIRFYFTSSSRASNNHCFPSCLCRIPQHLLMFVLVRSKRANTSVSNRPASRTSSVSFSWSHLSIISQQILACFPAYFLFFICNCSRRQATAHIKLRSVCCHGSSCCWHLCNAH